jgi:N-acetylneuraminate synthase
VASNVIINGHEIGEGKRPFIIAEMSGNHNGSLHRAFELVDAAADAGAQAIKLQTYTPDTMTLDLETRDFLIEDQTSLWKGKRLYELYKEAQTPWDWHDKIFAYANAKGLTAFSTPFDFTAVDFLESLNVPCYKLASFEITHLPLIKKISRTRKPLIISTGMATIAEIAQAVETAVENGAKHIILLKCTSEYPANPTDSNLKTIPVMRRAFDLNIGLSDHTLGIGAAIASVALGSCVIEKHLTLSRGQGGVDAGFSLEPSELKSLVEEINRAWLSLGETRFGRTVGEANSIKFRRSIYALETINKGEKFSEKNIALIRPSYGLAPHNFELVLGLKASRKIERGEPLRWDMIV